MASIRKGAGYFIVELIIIVLGITISFLVNEWREQRQKEKLYLDYLASLDNDLKTDSAQIVSDLRSYNEIQDYAVLLLTFDVSQNKPSPELIEAIEQVVSTVEFLPNKNTFEVLQSTGSFMLFKDKELAKLIVQLYQFEYPFIRMAERRYHDIQVNTLYP